MNARYQLSSLLSNDSEISKVSAENGAVKWMSWCQATLKKKTSDAGNEVGRGIPTRKLLGASMVFLSTEEGCGRDQHENSLC